MLYLLRKNRKFITMKFLKTTSGIKTDKILIDMISGDIKLEMVNKKKS